jgi:hypothetical protein
MIDDASIFIVTEGAAVGNVVSVYDGGVNDFGAQSFKKNPIVLAIGGSTGGVITTLSPPPFPFPLSGVPFGLFLQDVMLKVITHNNTA